MINLDSEIKRFVEQYFYAYFTKRDFKKVKNFLAKDVTVIGTGKSEFGNTPEEAILLYHKDLSEVTEPISYDLHNVIINYKSEDFVLVSGKFSVNGSAGDITFSIPEVRFSFTIIKEEGILKILHLHNSTPNDQQEDDELYPLEKLIRQNQLLNEKVEERTKELSEVNEYLKKSNNTKNRLLSIISHDIRSPFNTLLGFIDVLINKYNQYDDRKRLRYLNIISSSSHNIYNLVDNLLIWSNLLRNNISLDPNKLNLLEVVSNCMKVYAESLKGKKITLVIDIDDSINFYGDDFVISTILRNLVSNSIKFTNSNGTITITAVLKKDENTISISVIDNGIGMEIEKVNNILNGSFFNSTPGTLDEKGTGLGLSICDELLKLNNSKLMVESEVNKGTKMSFELKTQ